MSGVGGGVSKLTTALIIIFAITLLTLLAELFYVFWRRRVRRRQANPVRRGGDEISQISSSESTFSSSVAASKDLLYFLCVRPPQFHLERNSAATNFDADDLNSDRQQSEMEVNIDIDLLKIQGMFGPPRFLFTIKEEEKEDLDSPVEESLCVGSRKSNDNKIDDEKVRRVSLEEHFKAAEVEEAVVAVEIDDVGVDDATPFSTPCASPSYFTPSASPVHEVVSLVTAE